MHAFDFILVLFSVVHAAAVTHVLSTAGEIIIASKRIRLFMSTSGQSSLLTVSRLGNSLVSIISSDPFSSPL